MPNWCSNNLTITSDEGTLNSILEQIEDSHNFTKLMTKATRAAIKLYLLLNNKLSNNYIDDRFSKILANKQLMTKYTCQEIIDIYNQHHIDDVKWNTLNKSLQDKIISEFDENLYDWFNKFERDEFTHEDLWDLLSPAADDTNKSCAENAPYWDLYTIIPPPVDVVINGFNGKSETVESLYDWNVSNIGVKWVKCNYKILNKREDRLIIEFQTPWSPALIIGKILSQMFKCHIKHIYAEAGVGYCGYHIYEQGVVIESEVGEMIYVPTTDDDLPMAIGPDYILDMYDHGG